MEIKNVKWGFALLELSASEWGWRRSTDEGSDHSMDRTGPTHRRIAPSRAKVEAVSSPVCTHPSMRDPAIHRAILPSIKRPALQRTKARTPLFFSFFFFFFFIVFFYIFLSVSSLCLYVCLSFFFLLFF